MSVVCGLYFGLKVALMIGELLVLVASLYVVPMGSCISHSIRMIAPGLVSTACVKREPAPGTYFCKDGRLARVTALFNLLSCGVHYEGLPT